MPRRTPYGRICNALGLRPARTGSGKLRYEGAGRAVYQDELRGEGRYDDRGIAQTFIEVERLRRSDPDAAIEAAAALKPVSPSYFVEVVQGAINRKLRNRQTGAALEQARGHRRILPREYFASVVQKHVESSLGNRREEEAMTVADEYFAMLPEELLETTTRAYYAKMRRRGEPEAALEHAWNFLDEGEFKEMGRNAALYHGRKGEPDWVKTVEVSEQGRTYNGEAFFNKWEMRGLLEMEGFDRSVHERMPQDERDHLIDLAHDLRLPEARQDQLKALMHETDFLAHRRRG